MSKDLYFIPLIAQALGQTNPLAALPEALRKIEELGDKPGYRKGYEQFQRFMKEVVETSRSLEDAVRALLRQVLTGDRELSEADLQDMLSLVSSRPDLWKVCTETGGPPVETEPEAFLLELIIDKDGSLFKAVSLASPFEAITIRTIRPGSYVIKLNTGRILWEGFLADRELLWSKAFPEEPLELAADTGDAAVRATLETPLMAGGLILRVVPGLESGRIQIQPGNPIR